MTQPPLRIAMWSGPRNISTAMMRAFENRPDTAVIDEPFYAAYLAATGLDHPMRKDVLASQPQDWREVAATLLGPAPDNAPVFYQKHMTHHMLPGFGTAWMASCRNVFLIRRPDDVIASYSEKRAQITLSDIGIVRQAELFAEEADRSGTAPLVIDSADIIAAPAAMLTSLCAALGLAFTPAMLAWPAGRRPTDGIWAPAWYDQVERSTGFAPSPNRKPIHLNAAHRRIADAAAPYYATLAKHTLSAFPSPLPLGEG
jgi:hypothetical protein